LIKSLHFMMTSYALKNRPGRWRTGPIFVHNERTDQIVHEGADIAEVPKLMHELVLSMDESSSNLPVIVRAGMAHLNLAMIHPFRDGNGRMARCLQSLVLAREGVLSPVFMSIEEYLGRNTDDYYAVLAEVGGGSWQPHRDARPWVRFILTAHLRQARTLQTRVNESEQLWLRLERLVDERGLNPRGLLALFDAALGLRIRRATYMSYFDDEPISDQTASRDLRQMVDAGLLLPRGEKRGRHYVGTADLRGIFRSIVDARKSRDDSDPFS
jgi:Fic family protein